MKNIIYTAQDVANWFLAKADYEAGDVITPLKLQKLLYYAQGWTLAILNKKLFEEDFQAWTHGPAIPSIYRKYKAYVAENIPKEECKIVFDKEVEDVLEDVLLVYGEHSAKYLERMTHNERPWTETRGNLPIEAKCETIISKTLIQNFFKEKLEELKN